MHRDLSERIDYFDGRLINFLCYQKEIAAMSLKWVSVSILFVVLVFAAGIGAGFLVGHSRAPAATTARADKVATKAAPKAAPALQPPDFFVVMASSAHPLFESTLRDYTKARFSDVRGFKSEENGNPTYFFCGSINSVNAYGGYEGWKQFVVIEQPQLRAIRLIYDNQIDDDTSLTESAKIVADNGLLVDHCGYVGGSGPQVARIPDSSARDFSALLQYNSESHDK